MKSLRSRLSDFLNSPKPSSTQGLSTALDARLELGLETRPELRLRVGVWGQAVCGDIYVCLGTPTHLQMALCICSQIVSLLVLSPT